MSKIHYLVFLFAFLVNFSIAQTTDLSVVVEAQDLSGNSISQIGIYQEFQYLVTVINGGNEVNNASFSHTLDSGLIILNTQSQNETGGASIIDPITITGYSIVGNIELLPSNSSVELKVVVKAPLNPGGIATSVIVSPPDEVTDVDLSNNQSVISIDVTDIPIDFTVNYTQTNPIQGTGISAWDEIVTFEITITNNSAIDYPINGFESWFNLESSVLYGRARIELESLICLDGTNGISCPESININDNNIIIPFPNQELFEVQQTMDFPSGSSLTFELNVKILEPLCGIELEPMSISSFIILNLSHINESSNSSNSVSTPLLESSLCPQADLCIETIQTNPEPSQEVGWNEEVSFVTTICNNGPDEVPAQFFMQNLSGIDWDIISLECNSTTGDIECTDFILTDQDQYWDSSVFSMPPNTTIEVLTTVIFLEDGGCTEDPLENSLAHIGSHINIMDSFIIDPNVGDNIDADYVILPPLPECEPEDYADLSITKTQINPIPPEGESTENTTSWGEVTYEIVAQNNSALDTSVTINDFMPIGGNINTDASLVSVTCISTTGTATCFDVENANTGLVLDGIPDSGEPDVFWEILPEENFVLPAQSSVSFHVVIDWQPQCNVDLIQGINEVAIFSAENILDDDETNNVAAVTTYFAPCVDLVVQTYPEFSAVGVNQNFNWIVDITNSNTSSNAINVDFIDVLGPQFTFNGSPTCTVTSGNASCIPNFSINGNSISGFISNMDAASTIQIVIPVIAPNFGGAFTNSAEAIPNEDDNKEITPDTNISISNVQVLASIIDKVFTPNEIITGQNSTLEFTLFNLNDNPQQDDISFTDNLPAGLTISGPIIWVNDNGCTATFNSTIGGSTVEVSNLSFPIGVSSCSFSVDVTSETPGMYINDNHNFTNLNNIDASQASATLTVIEDTSDVDIEVLKFVFPEIVSIGDEVEFTVSVNNLGTTIANNVVISDVLPDGYLYISSNTSYGIYIDGLWSMEMLQPNQLEKLTITCKVMISGDYLNVAVLNSVIEQDRNDTNNEDSAKVEIDNCLVVSEGMSPNEDGYNDTFIIPCIENYPNNNLKIFNRLGVLIFEQDNYNNTWKGKANRGVPNHTNNLPSGVYFYILNLNNTQTKKGWFYMNY